MLQTLYGKMILYFTSRILVMIFYACIIYMALAIECLENRLRCLKPHAKLSHKHHADHIKQIVFWILRVRKFYYNIVYQHYDCKFPKVQLLHKKPVEQIEEGKVFTALMMYVSTDCGSAITYCLLDKAYLRRTSIHC